MILGKPFALIGGSTAQQLRQIMDKEKLPWRSFADVGNAGAGPIATKWNLWATSTYYFIDHKGTIRNKWAGPPGNRCWMRRPEIDSGGRGRRQERGSESILACR
jgi:hypothetical protein